MSDPQQDSFWTRIIAIVSGVLCCAIAFLLLGPRPEGVPGMLDVSSLPLVNASINVVTTGLLLLGFYFIKQRNFEAHKRTMLTAFGSSTAFLVTYSIYHWFKAAPTPYTGDVPGLFYTILISHIILAAIILPLALFTLYRGWTDNRPAHRKIARITLPLWLYVSMTGVLIYLMLY
jgi:putative membrane protein